MANDKANRSEVIQCYVTPKEKVAVEQQAIDVGLTASTLARLLLQRVTPKQALRLAQQAKRRPVKR